MKTFLGAGSKTLHVANNKTSFSTYGLLCKHYILGRSNNNNNNEPYSFTLHLRLTTSPQTLITPYHILNLNPRHQIWLHLLPHHSPLLKRIRKPNQTLLAPQRA